MNEKGWSHGGIGLQKLKACDHSSSFLTSPPNREAVETLRADLTIANAATARAEGAKELLAHQLEAKSKEAIEVHSVGIATQQRAEELRVQLEQCEAKLELLRTLNPTGESPEYHED
ncbi:hypothetical protein [Pseudomonas syringae]|uniref:hypothetical protein n=1 Tax=Pseudomonas syringae TaxID=317 RepID=UPI00040AA76E|nr:hypothetical protein [Pseudomonas syringae]MCH5516395.1 hypothetical protein [Pseudomonas syringae pv. syringae]MCH5629877.1 hypothetical protein [Pseudomonas syringae pv. syringae]PPS42155.1 hypothetical protein B0F86_13020 [Pseudomonas syringae]